MTIDTRAFRDAMGCFATGICVATAFQGPDRPIGVTVNSFSSVSLDPPLVLFCIDRTAACSQAFLEGTGFGLSVLADDQQALSTRFASAPLGERWQDRPVEIWDSGAPILTGGLATLDCARYGVHDGGDHLIIVGRVLRLESRPGAPLIYFRGRYAALA